MSTYVGLDNHGETNVSITIKHLQKILDIYGDLRLVLSNGDPYWFHDPSGSVVVRTSSDGDGNYYIDDEGELTIILDQV